MWIWVYTAWNLTSQMYKGVGFAKIGESYLDSISTIRSFKHWCFSEGILRNDFQKESFFNEPGIIEKTPRKEWVFFPGSTESVNRILLAQDSICIPLLTSRMVGEEGNWGHFENNPSHSLRDIRVHLSLVSLGRVKAALVRASAIGFGGLTVKSGYRHICLWLVCTLGSRHGTGLNHCKSCWPPHHTSSQHHPAGTESLSTLFLTRQFDFHQPWSQLLAKKQCDFIPVVWTDRTICPG